jgi:hypothetical protein
VGLVSCDDVQDLQKQVNTYRTRLGDSIDALTSPGVWNKATSKWEPRPLGNVGPHGATAWRDLGDRASHFEEESCILGIAAGSQFDRGRALITELDGWRDYLASIEAPELPAPVVVPHADVSIFGGVSIGLALVLGFLLLHEFHH